MDAFWRHVEQLFEAASRHAAGILLALGTGLARSVHSWQLGRSHEAPTVIDPHLAVDLGEIVAFVALAAWAARRGPLCKRSWPLLAAIGCLALAMSGVDPALFGLQTDIANTAGCFGMGCSYALLLLVWLEAAGCLPPIQALLALAGSYVVGPVGWLALNGLTTAFGGGAAVAMGIICALLLVQAYRVIPTTSLPAQKCVGQEKRTVCLPIVAWVGLMSLAYGFGDYFVQTSLTTLATKAGMALPFLFIICSLAVLRERLDIRTVYWMSVALMAVGVLSACLSFAPAEVSQTLMSAAHTASLLIVCVIACTSARRNRESAIFGCGLLLAVSLTSIVLGNSLAFVLEGHAVSLIEPAARTACTVGIAAVMALAVYLMRDEDLSSLLTSSAAKAPRPAPSTGIAPERRTTNAGPARRAMGVPFEQLREALDAHDADRMTLTVPPVANQAGLSRRETAVFELMLAGDSTGAISEKLFIAPGTVRAHMSRIYEKLGVHSREEFNRLFES